MRILPLDIALMTIDRTLDYKDFLRLSQNSQQYVKLLVLNCI